MVQDLTENNLKLTEENNRLNAGCGPTLGLRLLCWPLITLPLRLKASSAAEQAVTFHT